MDTSGFSRTDKLLALIAEELFLARMDRDDPIDTLNDSGLTNRSLYIRDHIDKLRKELEK